MFIIIYYNYNNPVHNYLVQFQDDDATDCGIIIKVMDDGVCKLKKRKGSFNVKSNSCSHKLKREPKTKETRQSIHWIDFVARVVFPFSYSLYLIGFLIYYTSMRD